MGIDDYLKALASSEPAPGGGSAATMVAAIGAALVAMVARITASSPKHAGRGDLARSLIVDADVLRLRLIEAGHNDEAAYRALVAAMAQPRVTSAEKAARTAGVQTALVAAATAPLHAAGLARDVIVLAERGLELENPNLASDLGCAGEFGAAAVAASAYNVRINHKVLRDDALREQQAAELHRVETDAASACRRVRTKTNVALT